MGVFSYVKLGKKIFGKQKTTGKTTNPFERKKMRSDRAAKIGQLKVDLAKLKGGSKKLQTSIDEVRAAMREKARVKKMGGGMMGRRFGMRSGTPFKKETNVDKIKKTFAPKKNLKKIPEGKKGEGLRKLKAARPDVTRKMGFLKRGGRA